MLHNFRYGFFLVSFALLNPTFRHCIWLCEACAYTAVAVCRHRDLETHLISGLGHHLSYTMTHIKTLPSGLKQILQVLPAWQVLCY
jgi:hypothetical protein